MSPSNSAAGGRTHIRSVDPAEAETDPGVAYAFARLKDLDHRLAERDAAGEPLDADQANHDGKAWVSPFSEPIDFASWGRTARIPHDRSAAFGALLHGLLCRTGDPDGRHACDGSGGTSSIAYDSTYQGGHRFWVDATPMFVAELAAAGYGLRTAEFQRIVPKRPALRPGSGPRSTLGHQATATALATLIHRHCADPVLVPIGCQAPADPLCPMAHWIGWRMTRGLENSKLSLVDLRLARLVARHPGPGDPRDTGKRNGVRFGRRQSAPTTTRRP